MTLAAEERSAFDTNVLISAMLFPGSLPALCPSLAQRSGVVLASRATLAELAGVISRPKFNARLSLQARWQSLQRFRSSVELVRISQRVQACRDPKDDNFLDLALNGNARILITGDRDLLTLHPWRGVRILCPADYLAARD